MSRMFDVWYAATEEVSELSESVVGAAGAIRGRDACAGVVAGIGGADVRV